MLRKTLFSGTALAAIVLYAGCAKDAVEPSPSAPSTSMIQASADDHHDKPGAHGGMIVSLGADNYHVEPVFEKGGKLRLYVLAKDEARIQEVDRQEISANVKLENETESEPIVLRPEPQPGDAEGKTSQFVGQLPRTMHGKRVVVTFTIRVGGDRFRGNFTSAGPAHNDGMPAALSAEDEKQLYLTPAGKYTQADIDANGGMTASEKFKGLRSSHNARTKSGDKICPISETKANPKFTWVVGGKVYEFCCPPCVDEFVKLAKEQPDQVKEPDAYVRR